MKGKTSLIISLLILFLLNNTLLSADIAISPESWDFGKIDEGKKVTRIFKIMNTGKDRLIIKRVRTSCGCTAALISSRTINPGGTSKIEVTFDSSGREGNFSEYVYIESNDPERPIKRLVITGMVDRSAYVRMYFFYSQDCKECLDIKNNYIPELNLKYASSLKVKYLEMNDPENYRLMLELERRYGDRLKNPPPSIFIDGQILDGEREIRQRLEEIVRDCYLRGGCPWPDEQEPVTESEDIIIERFKDLGVLAVVGGGLLDGINPCAFTTLICFITYLFLVGRKGKEIILVGSIFTLAVFTSYLLVGIGLFEFVKRITILPLLARIISLLVAGGVVLLGILSLYDYYLFKRGRLTQSCPMSLGRVVAVIKRGSNTRHYLWGAFLTGLLISILEFFCTGQIYLPIIVAFRYVPDLQIHALFYLVLYNLMFVLPLIIVFLLAYSGISSERIAEMSQRHLGKVKILRAILFFGLAGILVAFNSR